MLTADGHTPLVLLHGYDRLLKEHRTTQAGCQTERDCLGALGDL